jgi:hypothetical protein
MISLPVILIKESITSLQSNLSESAQYMPVSEPSEPSEPSQTSEPSTHLKTLFLYSVL